MKKQLLTIALGLAFTSMFANDIQIGFAASGAATSIETIKVDNLTKGTNITITGSDVLVLTSTTAVDEIATDKTISVFPNPLSGNGTISFTAPVSGLANISIINEAGLIVALQTDNVPQGNNSYSVSGLPVGVCYVAITGVGYSLSTKILSIGNASKTAVLKQTSADPKPIVAESTLKSLKSLITMPYSVGDELRYTAISGTFTTVITEIPTASKTITFTFTQSITGNETITDAEGNVYNTVKIGTQTWMVENLKTTKYNNGDLIGTTSSSVSSETAPKYQWPVNGSESNVATYGRLYTQNVIMDSRGVCPTGWHIPTKEEFKTLQNNGLTDFKPIRAGYFTGSLFAEFNPAGYSSSGSWWTSTDNTVGTAWYMINGTAGNYIAAQWKICGMSVRCLKD